MRWLCIWNIHFCAIGIKVLIVYSLKDSSKYPFTLKLMCSSDASLDLSKIIRSKFGAILTCMRSTK